MVDQADAAERVAELFVDPEQRRTDSRHVQEDADRHPPDGGRPAGPEFDAFRRRSGDDPGTDEPVLPSTRCRWRSTWRACAGRTRTGPDEIGLLVFVTSTGFIAPGVDVAIVKAARPVPVGVAAWWSTSWAAPPR